MAEQMKKTTETGILEEAKKALTKAADLASLQLEYHYLSLRRKDTYARIGELTYILRHPTREMNEAELQDEMELEIKRITKITREMTRLAVQIKILKMDMRK